MNEGLRIATTEDVLAYVSHPENTKSPKRGRICGDGRYDDTKGRLSRFGADAGYLIGVLELNSTRGVNYSPIAIAEGMIEASIKDGVKFHMHTDDYTQNSIGRVLTPEVDELVIGCKHIKEASLPQNEASYGVVARDVVTAVTHIQDLATRSNDIEIEVLPGSHQERGVLFNRGKGRKIRHKNGDEQYFVVAAKRDEDYVRNVLFPRVLNQLPRFSSVDLQVDEFLAVLDRQTMATARIVAKGLPVFNVNLDGRVPRIEAAGVIE